MFLNQSALAKAGSTDAFETKRLGWTSVVFMGNLNNETLTMEISTDEGANWKAFYAAGVAQTYTNNADVVNCVDYYLPGGYRWRFTCSNGAGTVSNVFVEISSNNAVKV